MKPDELKEKLIDIEKNNFGVDNVNVFETAFAMMQNIGSIDPVLRDELIYHTFHQWTINGVLSTDQMRHILYLCLDDEHLFYKIGEKNTDSVFTRTFSVLLIPLAFYVDSKVKFLSENEVNNVKDKVIQYLKSENDVRGYVMGKGWAHSTAHAADALEDIAKSEYIGHDALLEILAAIKGKICIDHYTYINNEDERMAVATLSVFGRALLGNDEIANWIKSFCFIKKTRKSPEDLHLAINTKNFLRSLYFMIYDQKDRKSVV
jgi:hypothetical protein